MAQDRGGAGSAVKAISCNRASSLSSSSSTLSRKRLKSSIILAILSAVVVMVGPQWVVRPACAGHTNVVGAGWTSGTTPTSLMAEECFRDRLRRSTELYSVRTARAARTKVKHSGFLNLPSSHQDSLNITSSLSETLQISWPLIAHNSAI